MDKKNTMLLTVVVVATLLVAVVGATFAYFTATQTSDDKTTTATVTTPTLATVSLENPTGALAVTVNNFEMAEQQAGAKYYATNVEGERYDKTPTPRVVSKVTVGGENVTYNCTWNVNVATSGDLAAGLVSGDAQVIFSGALNQTVDVKDAKTSYEVAVNGLTSANAATANNQVSAVVQFNNTAKTQNALQGGNFIVSITNSDFVCTVAQ